LDLQQLRSEEHPQAAHLYSLLEEPRRLIISILCGNELINVAAAANMAGIVLILYGEGSAELVNICVMVPLLLLFGEVTPKTIAVTNPVRVSAGIVAAPMSSWVRMVGPLRWIIRALSDHVTTWIVGEEKSPDNLLHMDEIRILLDDAASEGQISSTEQALVNNLLEAGREEIASIMIPRTETLFVDIHDPVSHVIDIFRVHHYNRVPVMRTTPDDFIGFLHAEDFIAVVAGEKEISEDGLAAFIHPPIVVPPTKKIDEMFDYFQQQGAQSAIVIDEFGGVEGMVSMKSVLRFIFSGIAATPAGKHLYEEQDTNHYIVLGDMNLTEFNHLTRFGLSDPRMTTVGGVLFRHLDRLPQAGDSVLVDGITMTVLEMDRLRIDRVDVILGTPVAEDVEDSEREGGE